MADWAVVAGHNSIIPGASGNGFQEHIVARQVKDRVIHYLRKLGETAHDCTDEDGRNKTQVWMNAVSNCNRTIGKNGFVIAIHLNAGGGTGCEVFDWKGTQKAKCQAVSVRLANDFSWKDRGWKNGDWIGLIKETQAPVIYIELCFIDNIKDITKLTQNIDMAAIGIVEEMTCKKIVFAQPKPQPELNPQPEAGTFLIRVKAPSLWYYDRPDWNAKKATVKAGEVFTVIETLIVNGSKMYMLKSSTYITANPQYVEII